jgi:Flp pilus assembly protein TadG
VLKGIKARHRAAQGFARDERGTQLVELAIVLPILLVLFGAAAEFGRFFYTYQTLAKATRTGARYLTIKAPTAENDEKAQNMVVYGNPDGTGEPVISGLTPGMVRVVREGNNPAMPDHVTVRIEGYAYEPVFNLVNFTGDSRNTLRINVDPSTKMRMFLSLPS